MKKKHWLMFLLKLTALLFYATVFITAFINRDQFSVDNLLNYSPENPLLAAVFVIALYAVKSITIVFPLMVLHILTGFLFPAFPALILNCIGVSVAYSIPYILGRFFGAEKVEKRINRNPGLMNFFEKQKKHKVFLSFFLRVIGCLPCDLISLYMGSVKISYPAYIISSLLGTLPGLIPATFIGKTVTNISSPGFIISLAATVISSVLSMLGFYIYNKRKRAASPILHSDHAEI